MKTFVKGAFVKLAEKASITVLCLYVRLMAVVFAMIIILCVCKGVTATKIRQTVTQTTYDYE